MRIVGGRWAGRPLLSPGGRVRPTSEGIRERWLTELGADLADARILELFAGSGALGLEALSRGARRVDFVEWSPEAFHALKGNVTALRARESTRIFKRDVFSFLAGLPPGRYEVALADPPYTSRLAERLVGIWLQRPFALVLSVEHPSGLHLPPGGHRWEIGETAVTTFRAPLPGAPPLPNPEASRT